MDGRYRNQQLGKAEMMPVGPLLVKLVTDHSIVGGKVFALVTEDGELVGSQLHSAVEGGVDELATITIRFHIDGESVRFHSNDG